MEQRSNSVVLHLEPLLEPEALDVLLAHLELLDLAGDRRGEPLDEANVPGDLEVRQLPLAELLYVLGGEVGSAGPVGNSGLCNPEM